MELMKKFNSCKSLDELKQFVKQLESMPIETKKVFSDFDIFLSLFKTLDLEFINIDFLNFNYDYLYYLLCQVVIDKNNMTLEILKNQIFSKDKELKVIEERKKALLNKDYYISVQEEIDEIDEEIMANKTKIDGTLADIEANKSKLRAFECVKKGLKKNFFFIIFNFYKIRKINKSEQDIYDKISVLERNIGILDKMNKGLKEGRDFLLKNFEFNIGLVFTQFTEMQEKSDVSDISISDLNIQSCNISQMIWTMENLYSLLCSETRELISRQSKHRPFVLKLAKTS